MHQALEILTVILVAVAANLALAHALELPGKLRLSKEEYLAVQPIYYPGFTIGGAVGEFGGMIALLILLLLTPYGDAVFWLTAAAFIALLAMHAAYWLVTHPVNNFWLKDFDPGRLGSGFFSFDPLGRKGNASAADWTSLRDRWEYSHIIRATLGLLSLILLATAVTS
jgi:hypothetical protein